MKDTTNIKCLLGVCAEDASREQLTSKIIISEHWTDEDVWGDEPMTIRFVGAYVTDEEHFRFKHFKTFVSPKVLQSQRKLIIIWISCGEKFINLQESVSNKSWIRYTIGKHFQFGVELFLIKLFICVTIPDKDA